MIVPTVRLRPDLQWHPRTIRGRQRWVVRDPLSTRFFYLSDREKQFLEGLRSPLDLDAAVRRAVAVLDQPEDQCIALLGTLERSQLVLSDRPGQGRACVRRGLAARRRSRWSLPLRVLALRVPVLDPTLVLRKLAPVGRILFSPTVAAMLGVLLVVVGVLLVGRIERLPPIELVVATLMRGETLLLAILGYVLIKSLHELSHALACQRWGAECHEVGVIFLAMTPCLYCDVSDTWKLASRYKRAAVAAAGVYAELWLAAIAGLVWLATWPGVVNSLALCVMVLGSLSTFLLNANPLLRYDGYYVLADLWNVPNLAEQAREALWAPVRRWLSRGRVPARPLDAPTPLLAMYGLLALVYRYLVLALVLWGVNAMFAYWGFQFAGHVVTALVLVGVVLASATTVRRAVTEVRRDSRYRPLRVVVLACGGIVAIAAVMLYPLPREVAAVGIVHPMDLEPVYAQRAGFLVDAVAAGQQVETGDVLVRMHYPDDQIQAIRWSGEVESLESELGALRGRLADDPGAAASIATLTEILAKRRQQLETLSADMARLTVTSWRGGRIYSGEQRQPSGDRFAELDGWSGTPLDEKNRGALLERGTLVAWIGDARRWRIEAYVSEEELLEFVEGTEARVRLDQRPGDDLLATVTALGSDVVTEVPSVLRSDARLPLGYALDNAALPRERLMVIEITPREPFPEIAPGYQALASVRISAAPRSLGERAWRLVRRSLRW